MGVRHRGRCDLEGGGMHAGDAITWKSTLMKMREDDVVSSSVITRYSITPHGSACHVAARGGEKGEARQGGRARGGEEGRGAPPSG